MKNILKNNPPLTPPNVKAMAKEVVAARAGLTIAKRKALAAKSALKRAKKTYKLAKRDAKEARKRLKEIKHLHRTAIRMTPKNPTAASRKAPPAPNRKKTGATRMHAAAIKTRRTVVGESAMIPSPVASPRAPGSSPVSPSPSSPI